MGRTQDCCGFGIGSEMRSAWIRIDLALLDPDPVSRVRKIYKKINKYRYRVNLISSLTKRLLYGTYVGMFCDLFSYKKYIFQLKSQLFVTAKPGEDPHWLGSLDPDPH